MRHSVELRMVFAAVSFGAFGSLTANADPGTEEPQAEDERLASPDAIGLIQIWGTAWDQDGDVATDPASYGDPEDDPGFKIRRARLGLTSATDDYGYSVLVGFMAPYDGLSLVGESIELVDAYASARLRDGLWTHVGFQKVPVSREALLSSPDLALGERAVATEWLAPRRDVGMVLDARMGDGGFRGRVGVFNGNGTLAGDTNPGVLAVLRLDISGGAEPGALDVTHGRVETVCWGIGLDSWLDQGFSTRTIGGGLDAALRAGAWSTMVEARVNRIVPTNEVDIEAPTVWAETTRIGGLAQVSYSWGAFEPAVQVSTFDDDFGTTDNGDLAQVLAGVTWVGPRDTMRVGAGYVKRLELGGAELHNDTARIWVQTRL